MKPSISAGETGSSEDVSFRDDQSRGTLRAAAQHGALARLLSPGRAMGRRAQLPCCWHRVHARAAWETNVISEPLLGTLLTCA